MNPHKQNPETFWARVDRNGDGCWEWQGCYTKSGYGRVCWDTKMYLTHRIAAWLSGMVSDPRGPKGSERSNQYVLHKCDNPKCCNPNHLFLGSLADNMQDCMNKKRMPSGANHPVAKFTAAQVADMRARYKGGESQRDIAREYATSPQYVHVIVSGKRHK